MKTFDEIVVTREGAVTTFRFNRPDQLNAVTPEMHQAMQSALDEFAADDSQQIGVITGTGRAFSAGSDLKRARDRHLAGESLEMPRSGYSGLVQRFDLDKPLIAAVNGLAIGGGFELALCCDLIIASSAARFGLPEPHLGLVAIAGGPSRLVQAVGLKRTMAIALTGELFDAGTGLALGFVNEVVEPEALGNAVDRWTAMILRGAPKTVRATKAMVHHAASGISASQAIGDQESLAGMRAWRASDERFEGPCAFAENRLPYWRSP